MTEARNGQRLERLRAKIDGDVAANLLGRVLTSFTGLIFLPIFLRMLGPDGYGLVGFYAVLVGVISLLDFGLGLTLNREMARLAQHPNACQERRDTLRSLESPYVVLVVATVLAVVFGAPVVGHWLRPGKLSREVVEGAIRLMGVASGLQLVAAFYQGGLFGLQRQVMANTVMVGFTLLRQIASFAALTAFGPRPDVYFVTQAAGYLGQTLIAGVLIRRAIGRASTRPRFRWTVLRDVRGYAVSVSGASILGAGLNQLDRVIASGALSLREFAFYTVATNLAGLLHSIIQPLNQAFFPKLTRAASSDPGDVTNILHRAGKIMAGLVVPAAAVLVAFSWEAIYFWTASREAADSGQVVARILTVGVLLNGLVSLAATSLFAAGRSGVMLAVNAVLAFVLLPTTWFMTHAWGGVGAATSSLLLNLSYLIVLPPLVRRTGFRGGWVRWWLDDVSVPIVTAASSAFLATFVAPAVLDRRSIGVLILICGTATAAATWGVMWLATVARRWPS